MKGTDTKGTFMAIADLSSAYSFIFLDNLQYAMRFAGRELEIPEWKMQMFERMAMMVLTNSYVETSEGYYKLGKCLPMGLGLSGEALDLVCLVIEIGMHGKVTLPELSRCSEEIDGWGLNDESKMMDSVIQYYRYRDDTFTYGEIDGGIGLRRTIYALGNSFLSTLDITVDLTHFVGSYLDCMFYKKLSGQGFVSFVRRKGKFPITFQHADSNCGNSVLKSIISGEVLRHRRICSSGNLAEINNICLKNELESRGYISGYLDKQIRLREKEINQVYDENLQRRIARQVPHDLVFGATTVYDSTWETHKVLRNFVKKWLVVSSRMPMIVPGQRLKTRYYTKKKDLALARKYLKKFKM